MMRRCTVYVAFPTRCDASGSEQPLAAEARSRKQPLLALYTRSGRARQRVENMSVSGQALAPSGTARPCAVRQPARVCCGARPQLGKYNPVMCTMPSTRGTGRHGARMAGTPSNRPRTRPGRHMVQRSLLVLTGRFLGFSRRAACVPAPACWQKSATCVCAWPSNHCLGIRFLVDSRKSRPSTDIAKVLMSSAECENGLSPAKVATTGGPGLRLRAPPACRLRVRGRPRQRLEVAGEGAEQRLVCAEGGRGEAQHRVRPGNWPIRLDVGADVDLSRHAHLLARGAPCADSLSRSWIQVLVIETRDERDSTQDLAHSLWRQAPDHVREACATIVRN